MENISALLIYTNPSEKFDEETEKLVRLQIDNHYQFDWKNVLLFTNFDFEYNGVRSEIVPCLHVDWDKESNKILVINYLLKKGLVGNFWYHDFDAYQNNDFDLTLTKDLNLATYTYKHEWNCGSFFFKDTASDLFDFWETRIFDRIRPRADEKVLTKLTDNNIISKERYQELNATYNITKRFTDSVCKKADKPLKILHFHPYDSDYQTKKPNLDVFRPLMSDKLRHIFDKHEIN